MDCRDFLQLGPEPNMQVKSHPDVPSLPPKVHAAHERRCRSEGFHREGYPSLPLCGQIKYADKAEYGVTKPMPSLLIGGQQMPRNICTGGVDF